MFSKKATKIDLTQVVNVKSKILSIFMAFVENMNFTEIIDNFLYCMIFM